MEKKGSTDPFTVNNDYQILYSIGIDYRCKIEGGVTIVHGVGLVIGKGAVIKKVVNYTMESHWEVSMLLKMLDFQY